MQQYPLTRTQRLRIWIIELALGLPHTQPPPGAVRSNARIIRASRKLARIADGQESL